MGAQQTKVPLTPPLSLPALGLGVNSSLDDALRALVKTREEIQNLGSTESTGSSSSGAQLRKGSEVDNLEAKRLDRPTPPNDNLLVVLSEDSTSGDPANDGCVLGGTFASKNGHKTLAELGVSPPDASGEGGSDDEEDNTGEDPPNLPRLCLAEYAREVHASDAGGGLAKRARCFARCVSRCGCCGRRGRRRKGCCSRFCGMLWTCLPEKRQEQLKPYIAQWRFYILCFKWMVKWLWDDRHNMIREFKEALVEDLWTPHGPPPSRADQVRNELRPFGYVFGIVLMYAGWDMFRRVIWAPSPPMDLQLS